MRANSFLLAAAALTLAFSSSATAQDVPLHAAQPVGAIALEFFGAAFRAFPRDAKRFA